MYRMELFHLEDEVRHGQPSLQNSVKYRYHFGLFAFPFVWLATAMSLWADTQTNSTDALPNILFCLADDQSWPPAGVYGDKTVHTPTEDCVAHNGMRFDYCLSTAPSCTASRAAILTGQYPYRLDEGADLWGALEKKFAVYPDLLERAGYAVGFTRKGDLAF